MSRTNNDSGHVHNSEAKLVNGELSYELSLILNALIRAYSKQVEDGKLFDMDLNDPDVLATAGKKLDTIGKMQQVIKSHAKVADLVIDEEKKGNFDSIKNRETIKLYDQASQALAEAKKRLN